MRAWPGSESLAPPARCLLLPCLEPTGGREEGKDSVRTGMTDRRGAAARGRAQPSRPGLSLATLPASPATQDGDRRGSGTFHCALGAGEELGGAIHLDR